MEPFGSPVTEVPLSKAPLVHVIAQVRFPQVLSIDDPSFVAGFQERIRDQYPILRQERQIGMEIGPAGVRPQDAGMLWRFETRNPDDWQVTLSQTFVSLSTRRYTNRADFLNRFANVLEALAQWLSPSICDRVGVRYIDRLTEPHLTRLPELIQPPALGILGPQVTLTNVAVAHALSDTVFRLPDASELRTRWGLLPAGATYDSGLEPVTEPSWVLDLDHSTAGATDFAPAAITKQLELFCERIYTFFRAAVTDQFLHEFGAQQ